VLFEHYKCQIHSCRDILYRDLWRIAYIFRFF